MRSAQRFQVCLAGTRGACLVAFLVVRVWGHETGDPQSETAFVKLHTAASPSTCRSGIEETPGLVRIEELTLKSVIGIAYGVKTFRWKGPHGWTLPMSMLAPSPQRDISTPSFRLSFADSGRSVQTSRTSESREVPAFALIVRKVGLSSTRRRKRLRKIECSRMIIPA
jgi:hypothetical protein